MGQQPGRKQSSSVPTKDARDATVQANEGVAKIRLGPRQRPQSVGVAALRVNLERRIVDRQTFKQRRSAALAE